MEATLSKRQSGWNSLISNNCYTGSDGNTYCPTNNPWNDWVRWAVLGVLIAVIAFLFLLCSCITARRRRRAGLPPYYGTGWAAGQNNHSHHISNYHPQNGAGYYVPPGQQGPDGSYYAPPNDVNWQPAPPYTAKGGMPPKYDAGAENNGMASGGVRAESIELQQPATTYAARK